MDTVSFNLANPKELFTHSGFPEGTDLSDNNFIANIPRDFTTRSSGRCEPILTCRSSSPRTAWKILTDQMRPRYLAQHIHQMWRAVNFNWPVKGYFHWSLVDNFEWERGWTQRFGLWALGP